MCYALDIWTMWKNHFKICCLVDYNFMKMHGIWFENLTESPFSWLKTASAKKITA